MPKKYTHEYFSEKVLNKKKWIKRFLEKYDSKKETILVLCNEGHEVSVPTKALVRDDKLKECPICKKESNKKSLNFCLYCGAEISSEKKFCSSAHSASFNNRKRKKQKFCLNCGKILEENRNKFCSNKCQRDFQYHDFIEKWKSGIINPEGKQISHHIRRYLLEKNDNKCSICGWNKVHPITKVVPLEVHHKDGNYKNNKEENLELLCPNCHSLTENYGSLNNGNGRNSI